MAVPRRVAGVGAVAAAVVAAIFATVGDGVPSEGSGPRGFVVDHGHTVTWVLLAAALGGVALGWPGWVSRWLGYAALGCYLVFLGAVIF